MEIPPGLMEQPKYNLTDTDKNYFDRLLQVIVDEQISKEIVYDNRIPKWQFLSYLCDKYDVVLHGSFKSRIAEIEPHKADDVREFSNQEAIYATTDGIWAIFFAILNRQQHSINLVNTCMHVELASGDIIGPLYYFSITQQVLNSNPWSKGAVYILPRHDFFLEQPKVFGEFKVKFPHWVSMLAVKPLGYLTVNPWDFPFLNEVHGHDDNEIRRKYQENPNWLPWL